VGLNNELQLKCLATGNNNSLKYEWRAYDHFEAKYGE
jgi:hypothetical protein